jgi:hypothetical protein
VRSICYFIFSAAERVRGKMNSTIVATFIAEQQQKGEPIDERLIYIQNSLRSQTVTEWPEKLFDSDCPRVCIALDRLNPLDEEGVDLTKNKYADILSRATRYRFAVTYLAVVIRTASLTVLRSDDLDSDEKLFKWWRPHHSNKALKGVDLQKSVCAAIGVDFRAVRMNEIEMHAFKAYIDIDAAQMWIFFTDGRIDIACSILRTGEFVPGFLPISKVAPNKPTLKDASSHLNDYFTSGAFLKTCKVEGSGPLGGLSQRDRASFVAAIERTRGNLLIELNFGDMTEFLEAPAAPYAVASTSAVYDALLKEAMDESIPKESKASYLQLIYAYEKTAPMLGNMCANSGGAAGYASDAAYGVPDKASPDLANELERLRSQVQSRDYFGDRFPPDVPYSQDPQSARFDALLSNENIWAMHDHTEQQSGPADANGASKGDGQRPYPTGNREEMNAFFANQSVFRFLRAKNIQEHEEITKNYTQNTDIYREKQKEFRSVHIPEFVESYFGNTAARRNRSVAVMDSVEWMEKLEEPLRDMPYLFSELGPAANLNFHLIRDLHTLYAPGCNMYNLVILVYTALAGMWHHDGLRPNPMLHGGHSVGKSFLMYAAAKLMPKGVRMPVGHETAMSHLVSGMLTDTLVQEDELNDSKISSKDAKVSASEKARLVNNINVTKTIEMAKAERGAPSKRSTAYFANCEEVARHAATNNDIPDPSDPGIARWMLLELHISKDPADMIIKKMVHSASAVEKVLEENIVTQWRAFFSIVLMVEKAIESYVIADVDMSAMIDVVQAIESAGNEFHFSVGDNPKIIDKMRGVYRLMTVCYAVYAAVCTETAQGIRKSVSGIPHTFEEAAPAILVEVEKYLCMTREIAVFGLSLMNREWVPVYRQKILSAISNIYLRELNAELPQSVAHFQTPITLSSLLNEPDENEESVGRSQEFAKKVRAPRAKQFVTNKVEFVSSLDPWTERDDLPHPEGIVDSSYLLLHDEQKSTRIDDVSAFIVSHIYDSNISYSTVRRELLAMSKLRMKSHLWFHNSYAIQKSGRTLPTKLYMRDSERGLPYTQVLPVLYSGRVPERASFVPIPQPHYLKDTKEVEENEKKKDDVMKKMMGTNNSSASSADARAIEYANAMQSKIRESKRVFTCMILFEAVCSNSTSDAIIDFAINSLAHRYQSGDEQTFLLASPTTLRVDDYKQLVQNSVDLGDAQSSRQMLTLFHVPRTITIKRSQKLRIYEDQKPKMQADLFRESQFSCGPRATAAARILPETQNCSRTLIHNADVDFLGLVRHHWNIGIAADPNYYWLNLKDNIVSKRKTMGQSFLDFRGVVEEEENIWRKSQMSKDIVQATTFGAQSNERISSFVNLNGRSSDALFGAMVHSDVDNFTTNERLTNSARLDEAQKTIDELIRSVVKREIPTRKRHYEQLQEQIAVERGSRALLTQRKTEEYSSFSSGEFDNEDDMPFSGSLSSKWHEGARFDLDRDLSCTALDAHEKNAQIEFNAFKRSASDSASLPSSNENVVCSETCEDGLGVQQNLGENACDLLNQRHQLRSSGYSQTPPPRIALISSQNSNFYAEGNELYSTLSNSEIPAAREFHGNKKVAEALRELEILGKIIVEENTRKTNFADTSDSQNEGDHGSGTTTTGAERASQKEEREKKILLESSRKERLSLYSQVTHGESAKKRKI